MVNLLLAALSGLFFWCGFAPLEIWIGPYLGAALLFYLLRDKKLSQRLTFSFVGGLSFFLALLHWSSVYVGAIPWLILAIGQALIFALIGLPRWTPRWESALSFAALFTVLELVRMKAPFGGFGWGRLGFTQIDSLNFLYPYLGVAGVSLLVASSSFAITALKKFYLFVAVFLFCLSYFLNYSFEREVGTTLQVTAIQGGVDNLGLDFNNRAMRVLQRHIDQTDKVANTDLYIWPENASDVDPIKNLEAQSLILGLIKEIKSPLLIGAVEKTAEGPTNSSILFKDSGEIDSRYLKQDLAPFGEYMPLRELAEAISPYAKRVNDFVPGNSWVKHEIKGLPFQTLICFEVLDDDHAKAGATGSSFVVAQTNNATFGESSEAAQQLQITRSRAAESGRDFAVVSTTGFTAHIDSRGTIASIAPQFKSTALTMQINAADPHKKTLAQRTESWHWIVFLGFIIGLARVRLSR